MYEVNGIELDTDKIEIIYCQHADIDDLINTPAKVFELEDGTVIYAPKSWH